MSRIDPPGASRSGVAPHARASGPYSPFGSTIHACRPHATWRHIEGFDQGRLPAADLAQDDQVGVGQHALAVQVPGIEAKRPTQQVPPDQRAAPAETAFGDEGVHRLEVGSGGPMGGRRFHRLDGGRVTTSPGPAGAST